MHTLHRGLVALLALMLAALYLPLAQAADSRIEISKGHTDGFYVLTDSKTPVVKVANGIRNTLYDPNEVVFLIDDSTYGTGYTFRGLEHSGPEGYYTASFDADRYFEPGWSAPGFRDNGFASMRIDFIAATGPGPIALFGNDPLGGEDEFAIAPFLEGGRYYIEPGASLPILGHTHAHWYFEHAGTYTITGQAVGVTHDGTELRSETFTEMFKVEKSEQDARPSLPSLPIGAPVDSTPAPTSPAPTAPEPTAPAPSTSASQPEKLSTEPVTISAGHIDLFNVASRGGLLELAAKDGTGQGYVYRSPESVTILIDDSAFTKLPASLAQQLAERGYFISENGTSQQTLPFMGWDTSAVAPDYSSIDLEFISVTGPGRILLFQSSPFTGLTSPFSDGRFEMSSGSVITQNFPSHVHTNWLFTEPGVYTVKVRAVGTPQAGDQRLASQVGTYTFVVGAEPSHTLPSVSATPVPSTMPHSVAAPASPVAAASPTAQSTGAAAVAASTLGTVNQAVSATASPSAAATSSSSSTSPATASSQEGGVLAHTGAVGVLLALFTGLLLAATGVILVGRRNAGS